MEGFEQQRDLIREFTEAWSKMTTAMQEGVDAGISPVELLSAAGVDVPPFAAPMLTDMFTAATAAEPAPGT